MYNLSKYKYIIIISLITVLIICIFIIKRSDKSVNDNLIEITDIKASEIVKDRYIYESKNKLTIGNNLKQIENGYYDANIEYTSDNINVFFNKLYKEEYSDKLYVNSEYLFEILTLINEKFNINIEENKIQELVVLISDKYIEYKNDMKMKEDIIGNLNDKFDYKISFNEGFLVFNINKR